MIKYNPKVLFANSQGLRAKLRDDELNLRKPRVFLANLPREEVSADLDRTIANEWPRLDLSASTRSGTRANTDKRARGVSDWECKQADQSGPALGDTGTVRRVPGEERADAANIRRSELLDLGRTVAMGCMEFVAR
jgi:hypothetical protein